MHRLCMSRFCLVVAIVVLHTSSVAAQQPPPALTGLDVVRKYESAVGKEAYKKLTSRSQRGVVEIAGAGFKGTFQSAEKAPNLFALEIRVEGLGTFGEGYDGKVAWAQDTEGVKELSGAEREKAIREADFFSDVNIQESFPNLKYLGKEMVEGREAHVVSGSSPARESETFYFDAQTWMIVRRDITLGDGKQGSILFGDYRALDGVKIPFLVRETMSGMVIRITDARHNVPLEDSRFAKPAPPKN